MPGRIQDFKLGGALKKMRRVEGGANICGVFRVKNHDFTPKKHIFSNFSGGVRRVSLPPGSVAGVLGVTVMVFTSPSTIFKAMSWRPVLLVEEQK